jgi:hypothetical protein
MGKITIDGTDSSIKGNYTAAAPGKTAQGWKISQDGTAEFNSVTVRNGDITGSSMSAGSSESGAPNYTLDKEGVLTANGANIAGIITATGGYIGHVAIINGGL